MIVDCHGHFTTAPAAHAAWRQEQLAAWRAGASAPAYPVIPDDDLRAALEGAQLRLADERGTDVTLFSPRASAMGHHEGDLATSVAWARACNDLVARAAALYPTRFAPVAQLPQSPGAGIEAAVAEAERCVAAGFVGVNLNPDPSGGRWTAPPLTDRYWYPLLERLCELDVPAMVHVSASVSPAVHATGAYYLGADTTVVMQLVAGDLFTDLPGLRLVVPHGGGAVPFHWGRFRGLSDMLGRPPFEEAVLPHVFFDTCVYHQRGVDLLLDVVPTSQVLFGSEAVGAVRGVDAQTGHHFDDTLRYVRAARLTDEQRDAVLYRNALRVYPRLASRLGAHGPATAAGQDAPTRAPQAQQVPR